jgi:hypothetical protein
MQMYLTTGRKNKATKKSFSFVTTARRLVPRALSVVLAAQCISLTMPLSPVAVWAAEDMSQPAAPSWNDVKSDSAAIMEGGSDTVSSVKPRAEKNAATNAEANAEIVNESDKASGDGKAIADATRAGTTSANAAVLTHVGVEDTVEAKADAKAAQAGADKAGENSDVPVVHGDATVKAPAPDAVSATFSAPVPATLPTNGAASTLSATVLVAPSPMSTTLIGTPPAPSDAGLKGAPQVGSSATLDAGDSLSGEMLHALGAKAVVNETVTNTKGTVIEDGVMVVDCDETAVIDDEIKYQTLETDEAKTHIKIGAVFPVVLSSQVSSKTSKKGDPIEARLKYDLKIGDRLIARKGAEVHGHINYSLKARPAMRALISHERWYRNSGCLGLEFDEVINEKGEHLPLVACPARASRIVNNKNEGRLLGVNKEGQIACPSSQQWRDRAIRIGIHAALAPAGVFSFGAVPIALGLYGAANPSFAFMKPVGQNVRHRRIKGFAWGFISGVPGGMIIEDSIVKGQETVMKPGDVFLAELRQEFNGEPAIAAQLEPNATVKVHGEIQEPGQETSK